MGRIRSVKPDICQHEVMATLTDAAERTFVRLWTHADDDGRGIDNVKLIKAAIYPLNDEKTEDVIDALLDELAGRGFLVRYEVDGRRYFQIPNFTDHQKPRHKVDSKHPDASTGTIRPASPAHPPQSYGEAPHTDGGACYGGPPQSVGGPPAGGEGRGVGDVGGGATGGDVPQWHQLASRQAPPLFYEEAGETIAALCDRFPSSRVSAAIDALLAGGRHFALASQLRLALLNQLAALGPVVTEPETELERLRRQRTQVADERDREGIDARIAEIEARGPETEVVGA